MRIDMETICGKMNLWRTLSANWTPSIRRFEDLLLSAALALMVLLPLAESLLRRSVHTGICGSTLFVQHLVLYVGMLGGAVAARERRLISLGAVTNCLKEPWKGAAILLSGSFASAITLALFWASLQFVLAKYETGEVLPYDLPAWAVLSVLPVGLGLIALRMVKQASGSPAGRLLALVLAGMVIAVGSQPFIPPDQIVLPALIMLAVAVILGAPIFTLLGGAALILFWGSRQPIAMVSID